MSKALTAPQTDDPASYLEAEARECCKKVFDRAFGSNAVVIGDPEQTGEPDGCLWFRYDFIPNLGGALFGLERTVAIELGRRLLSAKGRASEHDHHAIHAVNHLANQLAAELAASLASRLATDVTSAESLDDSDLIPPGHTFLLTFESAELGSHSLFVRASAELIAALSQPASPVKLRALADPTSRNLDVLLDVEMPVSISFGTTRIPLKDVARLNTGSIIELNRTLSEPIQVLVNNCSIARGEVVVVDGKFAVRIKDIISRQDRLRSLT